MRAPGLGQARVVVDGHQDKLHGRQLKAFPVLDKEVAFVAVRLTQEHRIWREGKDTDIARGLHIEQRPARRGKNTMGFQWEVAKIISRT